MLRETWCHLPGGDSPRDAARGSLLCLSGKKQGLQNSWRRPNNSYNILKPFFALMMTLTAEAWGNDTTARENKPLEPVSDMPALPSPICDSLLSTAPRWMQTAWKQRWTSLHASSPWENALKAKYFLKDCSKCTAVMSQAFQPGAAGEQPSDAGSVEWDCRPGSAQRGDQEFTFPKDDNTRAFIADQCTSSLAFPVAQPIYYRHKCLWGFFVCLFFSEGNWEGSVCAGIDNCSPIA